MADVLDDLLNQFGQRIVTVLQSDIRNAPTTQYGSVNASGRLANSIRYEVTTGVLRVFSLDYIYYLQHGRKPGKFPPRQPILDWIKDKGIRRDKISANSLAYLIQRKISQKGTTIFQQGGSTLVSNTVNAGLVSELKSKYAQNLGIELVNNIRQFTGSSNIVKMQL